MGVPRLFKYILDNFPDAITHFKYGEFSSIVDYLYLDANGLLHQAAQLVYNYGQMKRNLNIYKDLSENEKCLKVYELFFQNIIRVTQIISPQKVLYIAIDGTAPLSKQAQQRQRRFIAAREQSSDCPFNSGSITPGTLFMHHLTRYMHFAIRKEMNTYPMWKNIQVYFSPSTVPSEGEHKILDFIRLLPDKERKTRSHCLFGPDGDLIMLTLATHIPKMYLFREDLYRSDYYHYLDMGCVRKELTSRGYRSPNDVVNDFIVEGFFVGNDFLPKIQMFYLLEDGLDTMIGVYRQSSKRGDFLTIDGHLSLKGFQKFVQILSTFEQDYLEDQASIDVKDPIFINHTLLKHITDAFCPKRGKIVKVLDFEGYRQSYYRKTIGNEWNDCSIEKMCHDYLKSFIWVLEYYVHGLPSWSWAYRWHYPPLMADFQKYLTDLTQVDFKRISSFNMGEASLPFVQLLSVLPPTSANLLPAPYRKLLSNQADDFTIDYEGKVKEYQGVALLPFIDDLNVKKLYSEVSTPKDYTRNTKGRISLFSYDSDYKAQFLSDMGNIDNLHVRKTTIPPHRDS